MDWWRLAILLAAFLAVGSTQRGGRRYVPDQPLEESLSVENHRFRSRGREVSGESRRGEGRRLAVEVSTEPSLRVASGRSRGRTEEPRQFHSISREVVSPDNEGKQFQARKNLEPERSRHSSREETPNERFKSKEQAAPTEASRGRSSLRGRSREEQKEVSGSRRGSVSSVTRFPSRTVEDAVSQSANNEPVRNRAGEGRRSRTDASSRNVQSRRNNLQDETRSLARPAAVHAPTERISGRTFSSPEPLIQKTDETLTKTELINEQQDITGNPDLSAKINGIPESTQYILPENEVVKPSLDSETELSGKIKETDIESPVKSTNGIESSKSSAKPASASTENTIEFPAVNDVEEPQRASRKLESHATDRAQSPRGRNRISDDSSRRRIPESSFRTGENTESRAGRGRSLEPRGRTRGLEEPSRARNVESSRRNSIDSTARNRNVLDSTRSSGYESTPRSRQSSREEVPNERFRSREQATPTEADHPSRNRNSDDVPKSSSDLNRNSRLENVIKSRESEETPRSRHVENSVRNHADTRGRSSVEGRSRSHEEERVRSHSERGKTRSSEDRTRSHSTQDRVQNDQPSKAERTRVDTTHTRGRSHQEVPSRVSEGRRSSHKYSAQIPEVPQDNGDRTTSKLLSRTRSKDFANFRSRVKTEETPQLAKPVTPETLVLSSEPTEALGSLEPSAQQNKGDHPVEEKNEIAIGATTEALVTSTSKQLGRSLTRKPLLSTSNRGRGYVKGPKLFEENENSGEVRDDDNYPEVYKQLKKSGTDPKEILVLPPYKK